MFSFITHSILKVVLLAVAIIALPYIFVGISVSSVFAAIIAALVFWAINLIVKPVLGVLTIPVNIITLGVFGLVLNAFLFWIVGYIVPGFDVFTFVGAVVGSLVVNIIIWVLDAIL